MSDFTGLSIAGRIATPTTPTGTRRALAWNLAADQRPEAVAFVESADDVARTVRFAAENDLKVAGQGTGHGAVAAGARSTGAILVKTERMRRIEVDPDAQTAQGRGRRPLGRAGRGRRASTGSSRCRAPRRTSASPASPSAAASAGSAAGYGFACNRVRAIELVTADGEPRTVDADNDPDLFWALRGGGGGYAIVTALHVNLLPIAEIYAGALVFPAELGADAVRAYRDWAAGVSEEVTSVVRFVTPPPIPDVPEPIRGRPLLTIDGACIGSQADGEATIAPLRELGEPIMDTFAQMPAAGLCRIHMDPENPVPGIGDGMTIRELPDEAIDAFVGARRTRLGLAAAAQRAAPHRRCARPPGREWRRPLAPRRRVGHVRRRDADDAGAGRGDPRPPRPDRGDDAALGRPTAATSTSPTAPATSTRSFPPRPAPASARSSASGTPTAASSPTTPLELTG